LKPQRIHPDTVIQNGYRRSRDGFSNYGRIFTRHGDGATGTEAEPEKKSGLSIADFIGMMDRAGVEIGVLWDDAS
jgi:hypothetical protein